MGHEQYRAGEKQGSYDQTLLCSGIRGYECDCEGYEDMYSTGHPQGDEKA